MDQLYEQDEDSSVNPLRSRQNNIFSESNSHEDQQPQQTRPQHDDLGDASPSAYNDLSQANNTRPIQRPMSGRSAISGDFVVNPVTTSQHPVNASASNSENAIQQTDMAESTFMEAFNRSTSDIVNMPSLRVGESQRRHSSSSLRNATDANTITPPHRNNISDSSLGIAQAENVEDSDRQFSTTQSSSDIRTAGDGTKSKERISLEDTMTHSQTAATEQQPSSNRSILEGDIRHPMQDEASHDERIGTDSDSVTANRRRLRKYESNNSLDELFLSAAENREKVDFSPFLLPRNKRGSSHSGAPSLLDQAAVSFSDAHLPYDEPVERAAAHSSISITDSFTPHPTANSAGVNDLFSRTRSRNESADSGVVFRAFDNAQGPAASTARNTTHFSSSPQWQTPSDAISNIKSQYLDDAEVANYEKEFQGAAAEEEIVVGLLDEEEVKQRELALEQERLEKEAAEAEVYAEREFKLVEAERAAKRRVWQESKSVQSRINKKEKAALSEVTAREAAVHREWARAESALRQRLRKLKATVKSRYGELRPGRAGVRKLKISWDDLPQPINVHIHRIRAVKNKLPKGNYVVLATLYDKLGGNPLRWTAVPLPGSTRTSNENDDVSDTAAGTEADVGEHNASTGRTLTTKMARATGAIRASTQGINHTARHTDMFFVGKSAATKPIKHRGRFYDTEVRVGNSIGLALPPPSGLLPSYCIIFEVFMLGTPRYPVDKVVAWGAVPAVDADFRPIRGKFKIPLIRNEVDLNVDQYVKLEQMISADLDNWLANMYIQITLLPREIDVSNEMLRDEDRLNARAVGDRMQRVREYDVEVSYTRQLLGHPEESQRRNQTNNQEQAASHYQRPVVDGDNPEDSAASSDEYSDFDDDDADWDVYDDDGVADPAVDRHGTFHTLTTKYRKHQRTDNTNPEDVTETSTLLGQTNEATLSSLQRDFFGSNNTKKSEIRVRKSKQHKQSQALRDLTVDGRGYDTNGSESKYNAFYYAVTRQQGKYIWGRRMPESVRKMKYIKMELLADLAERNWKTLSFWLQIFLLLIALYLRIYIHYLAQWMLLRSLRIPVYSFDPSPYDVTTKYVASVLPFEYEFGAVMAGPVGVCIVMCIFVFSSWACLTVFGHIPEIPSRFFAFFGLGAVFNPLLIFLVDLCAGNYNCKSENGCGRSVASPSCRCHEGDAWKLPNRFIADEGSAVAGVILTVFMYLVLMVFAAFLLYVFLLHLHMDGRMLDLYRRLNAPDTVFLVPDDLEISPAELSWICAKTTRWRGKDGTLRKIAVCEYILTDPLDDKVHEKTSHLIIYHARLDGTRELYRHFLRLPDGGIIEIFGDIDGQLGIGGGALKDVLLANQPEVEEEQNRFWHLDG